jgi:hypothetical protein
MSNIIGDIGTAVESLFEGKSVTLNNQTVSVTALVTAFTALGKVNFAGIIESIMSGKFTTTTEGGQAVIAIEDVVKIAALFDPPLAIALTDFEIVYPILAWLITQAKPASQLADNPTYQALWPNANWKPDSNQPVFVPAPKPAT